MRNLGLKLRDCILYCRVSAIADYPFGRDMPMDKLGDRNIARPKDSNGGTAVGQCH